MASTGDEEQGTLRSDQSQLMFDEGFSFSGYERDSLQLRLPDGSYLDVSGISGIDSLSDGRAAVFADFDNDGDLDVFRTAIQGQAHLLFRNDVGQDSRWLRVALVGDEATGSDAFGSVVRVKSSAGTMTKIKSGGSGYLSQHDPRLLFGLGDDEDVKSIEVTWPDGRREHFPGPVAADSTVALRRGTARAELVATEAASLPDPLTAAELFSRDLHVQPGRPAPEIPATGPDGETTTLAALVRPGRRLLVNVWATWCIPCGAEMPELEALRAKLEARGIDLVGLSVDTDVETEQVRDFAAALGARYPILIGGVPAIERIYASDQLTVPFSFLLDEQGIVTDLIPGWSARTRKIFEALAAPAEPAGS